MKNLYNYFLHFNEYTGEWNAFKRENIGATCFLELGTAFVRVEELLVVVAEEAMRLGSEARSIGLGPDSGQ